MRIIIAICILIYYAISMPIIVIFKILQIIFESANEHHAHKNAWTSTILAVNLAPADKRANVRRQFTDDMMLEGWHWDACDRVVRF